MSDDDFAKRMDVHHQRWHGEQWDPQKTRNTFPLWGKAKRIEVLEQLDGIVRDAPATQGALRDYTRLTSLKRDLEYVHSQMIKAGR